MLSYEWLPSLMTGLTVSLLHAALPTHWLPFVFAAKSQKWTYVKTASVLLIAGIGHVITTVSIGALLIWAGFQFTDRQHQILIYISGLAVLAFGAYNIFQHLKGQSHSHCQHSHPHNHNTEFQSMGKDGWAILSLLSLLTFSPCESFLPVYLSAWPLGWKGFMALSAVLALGTLFSMLGFMSMTFWGINKWKFHFVEKYEKLITGILLVVLAVVFVLVEILNHSSHSI